MSYGNLINRVMENTTSNKPTVGMGATILGYSDRHAATVVSVSKDGKSVDIQRDTATRTDKNGMSECQDYEYSPNPDAPIESYTLRKNGTWVREGESMKGGTKVALGYRDKYYDYSF